MFEKMVSFHEPIKNIFQVEYNKDMNLKTEKNGWRALLNFFHIFSSINNSPNYRVPLPSLP